MRGSPLWRAFAAFLLLLALGWPLWRVTHVSSEAEPGPAKPAELPRETGRAAKVHLDLAFTTPPRSLKVRHLGKEIWSDAAPRAEMSRDLQVEYPVEGVDFAFEVNWPPDAPLAAMRARLIDPAGQEHEKSLWGRGPAEEVLTFP